MLQNRESCHSCFKNRRIIKLISISVIADYVEDIDDQVIGIQPSTSPVDKPSTPPPEVPTIGRDIAVEWERADKPSLGGPFSIVSTALPKKDTLQCLIR